MIVSIVLISLAGIEPSRRLFRLSFEIEKPVFSIIIATIIAAIGSSAVIPVVLIRINPRRTPSDE